VTNEATRTEERHTAATESDAAPESPTKLTKHSWGYVARKTAREFSRDECTDLAAALTYYSVLALFPALIAMLSLVGLVGQGPSTVRTIISVLNQVGAGPMATALESPLQQLSNAPGKAGIAFVLGLALALWSASGYVGAFGRAMNRMYEVEEGRPVWKLRPVQLLVTLVCVVLAALVAMALVLTGPAAKAVGGAIGLGSAAVTTWNIAKWPVMLLVVIGIVALLYYATPNVKQPRFRWISIGAAVAIGVWILASAAFGLYVATFASYDKTYGSLAGVVVCLLWLWLRNLALLFGAELDCELERGRELQAGLPAEESLQLPPRDTRVARKQRRKREKDIARGRELRESHGQPADTDESTDETTHPQQKESPRAD
jgi:membrane protein